MRGGRIRAGDFVRSGPSGAPPPYARVYEVGNATPVGALVRYPSALYYDRVADKGWLCTGSTSSSWMDVGAIAALGAADFVDSGTDDPSVVGVAAPVGSRYRWANGAKAWLKYGAGNTAWRSLNETRASVIASGGPLSTLDLAIAVPAANAVAVRFSILASSIGGFSALRLSGATATLSSGSVVYGAVVAELSTPDICWQTAAKTFAIVHIGPVVETRRLVRSSWSVGGDSTYCGISTLFIDGGVLTSIGIAATGGANIPDGSTITATVADFCGGML